MHVFVTGATGFIGFTVVQDLIQAGHEVLGLARSEESAKILTTTGAKVQRGDLQDLESLRNGAAASDGVIHTAFIHDFSNFKENCEIDGRAIDTIGEVLAGSDRPLVVSAGIHPTPGRPTTEDDDVPAHSPLPRVSEQAALAWAAKGVRAMVMRLPQVHDRDKAGLVTYLVALAKEKGVSAYVGEGRNHWVAAHRLDVAPLYRLALEKGSAGAKFHAVTEEGVPLRDIAQAVGKRLKVPVVSKTPEEAAAHFGWLGYFAQADITASSALTRQRLGWQTTQKIGLIEDVAGEA